MSTEDDCLIASYLNISDCSIDYINRRGFSKAELTDFYKLAYQIASSLDSDQREGYYIGYTAKKGVREQFDILRFSENCIVNIELKSSYPQDGFDAMLNQLVRHSYYLKITQKIVFCFVFVSSTNELFMLDENKLKKIDITDITDYIESNYVTRNILEDFNLSSFIISPYTEPEKFMRHEYYLTEEQVHIRNIIEKSSSNRICIIGGPGTGKSLLLFDLAIRYMSSGKNVVLIFGSYMSMHEALKIRQYAKITIIPIKYYALINTDSFDVVLVDESQRIFANNIDKILSNSKQCIVLAIDHQQTLHSTERRLNTQKKVSESKNFEVLELKRKIRTDEAMASFIMKFLDLKVNSVQPYLYSNVDAKYFQSVGEAKLFIEHMCNNHSYVSIEMTEYITKSTKTRHRTPIYSGSITTHSTLGREYDNIIVPIDHHFFYNDDAKLTSNYSGYYPYYEDSMIFQALTRVRNKLLIVVINNPEIFKTLSEVINWYSMSHARKENRRRTGLTLDI